MREIDVLNVLNYQAMVVAKKYTRCVQFFSYMFANNADALSSPRTTTDEPTTNTVNTDNISYFQLTITKTISISLL